ncbi:MULTISPECIES: YqzL family protein [unclassified Paenibacillus]|nr:MULTISPECIES: YqzL family protein [unclassified Paenibacillus]PQP80558.1 YqzL family protein [Paenibacillus sp. PCH8]
MRDFSWKVFAMTGDVESYLLYTEACNSLGQESDNASEVIEDEEVEG